MQLLEKNGSKINIINSVDGVLSCVLYGMLLIHYYGSATTAVVYKVQSSANLVHIYFHVEKYKKSRR